ncbi:lipocalin-like domain-containing protein [Mycobacterium sp. ML4]
MSDQIVGAWQLMSFDAKDDSSGSVFHPLGTDAVGLIVYTHDGYMSAQLMRAGRKSVGAQSARSATADYLAYGGPYHVDEQTGVITHDVMVSLLPDWLHTTQLRHGTLDGTRLTLVADVPTQGSTLRATLVWGRVRADSARSRDGTQDPDERP